MILAVVCGIEKMNLLLVTVLIACSVERSSSANILVVLPLPFYSFTANYLPVIIALANRGHNVTLVSPFSMKEPVANLTEIKFPNIDGKLRDCFQDRNPIKFFGNPWIQLLSVWRMGLVWMKNILEEDAMRKLISDTGSNYDLVIVQIWHLQEYLAAFGHKYNAPVIGIAPRIIWPLPAYFTGNHLPTSYVPVQTLPYSDRMSFIERAINLFHYYWYAFGSQLYYLREQESLMRAHFKYAGSENLPPLTDMLRNVSLTLMDSSVTAIGYPTPFLKNVVEFGAINVAKKSQSLPADLQQFLDNATDGVIYFSFGSVFLVSELDSFKMEAIISALGQMKQKVLIKVEAESGYINMSRPNTLVRQWLPQPSILAHPNCKLFVTHCGLHSLMEAIYHKVPMIAIPLVLDQPFNAKLVETLGIGRTINFNEVTKQKLFNDMNAVLSNVSYKENIIRRSAILKDTPTDVLDNAIYWIEYVIRHRGAAHLRPAVLDSNWYQYLMLDVIALYLLIVSLLAIILIVLFKTLFTCIKWVYYRNLGNSDRKLLNEKSKSE